MFREISIEELNEVLESQIRNQIFGDFQAVKTEKNSVEKKVFSMRHAIATIDDYIRQFGYTVTNDAYSKSEMTLRKLENNAWMFDGKLDKRELIEFAKNL